MSKPAARATDMHTCPVSTHGGGPLLLGHPTVLIGNLPAAALGDACTCSGPADTLVQGSMSVLINGKPAARLGDVTAHGGVITTGCPTVLIGDVGVSGLTPALSTRGAAAQPLAQMQALGQAARHGAAGCEQCESES